METKLCPFCGSDVLVNAGKILQAGGIKRQRCQCKSCGRMTLYPKVVA